MTRKVFVLAHDLARQGAIRAIQEAPAGYAVVLREPNRSLDQNARLWAMLGDVSQQVEWYGKRLTAEDWKHVFSASLRRLEVVPNLDGTGFVALGMSTSRLSKREFSDLIELIFAFGAERGVVWSDPQEQGDPRVMPGRAAGGHARAAALSADQRREIARKGAAARWAA